eukprot:TRINITY_DN2947_c0_g1_i1.p1 TRINITY_DN2947_c0_g1~~TRINITY_DN2947_c0_g1_i1.p1  ORF type:complete len:165 (+),score=46.68 TRINITY_DN2947_c0_g1_i1:77-571(+)
MCIRDRYQRRVHGENCFKQKVLKMKTQGTIFCLLLVATIVSCLTEQQSRDFMEGVFVGLRVQSYDTSIIDQMDTKKFSAKRLSECFRHVAVEEPLALRKQSIECFNSFFQDFSNTYSQQLERDQANFGRVIKKLLNILGNSESCLLYTSPSPRDRQKSRMPSSA